MAQRDHHERTRKQGRKGKAPSDAESREGRSSGEVAQLGPGTHFGRYEILSRLATGGMAEVWLAKASSVGGFEKRVVLKTMLPHLAESPQFTKMFISEASLAAQLSHPNIVHIFDLGEIEGRYFIAMEYVAGRTLRQIRRRADQRKEKIPHWFLLRAVIGACEGLQFAHDFSVPGGRTSKLVHRDVSPENIIVSFNGVVKVLDFGVARGAETDSSTSQGILVGKLLYTAPERVAGIPADRRSDIYALGVILYEYLTETRPFAADDEIALLAKVAHETPRDPREIASVPDELARITMKAMAREPRERYQEASALARDLRDYLRKVGTSDEDSLAAHLAELFSDSPEVPAIYKKQPVPEVTVKAENMQFLASAASFGMAPMPTTEIEEVARGFESEETSQEVLDVDLADADFDVALDSVSDEGVVEVAPAEATAEEIPIGRQLALLNEANAANVPLPVVEGVRLPAGEGEGNARAPEAVPLPTLDASETSEHLGEAIPSHPSMVFRPSQHRHEATPVSDVFKQSRSKEPGQSDVFTPYSRKRGETTPPVPDIMSRTSMPPTMQTVVWGPSKSSSVTEPPRTERTPAKSSPKSTPDLPQKSAGKGAPQLPQKSAGKSVPDLPQKAPGKAAPELPQKASATSPAKSAPDLPQKSTGRPSGKEKSPAAAHIERGFSHMRGGRFFQALVEWEAALVLDPDNGAVRANLARLRRRLEEE